MARASKTEFNNRTECVEIWAGPHDTWLGGCEHVRIDSEHLSVSLILKPQDLHALWVTLGQSLKEYGF